MHLETISRKSKTSQSASKTEKQKPKLVFVHGICVGAWVWDEFFLPYFAEHGFEAHALSLRGHGTSGGSGGLMGWGLDDYSNDLDDVVTSLEGPVVVIGHSMGGAVVQNWLRIGESRKKAVGAALLASVPPWGLMVSAVRMGLLYPQLSKEISRMLMMGTGNVDKNIMHESLFSKGTSDLVFNKFIKYLGDESLVASIQVQGLYPFAPLPFVPLPSIFVGGAEDDRFIPNFEVERTASYYGVDAHLVKDLAHSVMLDANWEAMAKPMLSWLEGM
jgi:pimeloyl-ACP methyl ester carboxylesterase